MPCTCDQCLEFFVLQTKWLPIVTEHKVIQRSHPTKKGEKTSNAVSIRFFNLIGSTLDVNRPKRIVRFKEGLQGSHRVEERLDFGM